MSDKSEFIESQLRDRPSYDRQGSFNATIEQAVNNQGRKKTNHYSLSVENYGATPVMSRHALEVFDDRGVSMMDAVISSDQKLSGKSKNSRDFGLNIELEDGYYILQAKVVFVGPGNVPFNAMAETFLEVIEGEKTVISRKEFYDNSLHNVAIQKRG